MYSNLINKKKEEGPLFMPQVAFATPKAKELLTTEEAFEFYKRHLQGDWGDIDDEDKAANDYALENDGRLLSVFKVKDKKIYIITEWDRSACTILLPEEY